VAFLLEFQPKALAYILYKKAPESKYRSFTIAKRAGGTREINAPSADLMLLQKRLSDLLQDCAREIKGERKWEDELAHGFKRQKSIISNASKHLKRRYVLNIDLQDFFGSINFGRVRGFLISDRNFALQPAVATILAQIACHNNALPQGSPCSPVISNLVGHILDVHLCKLASQNGCTYSRYADDITFSTNEREFPASIARKVEGEPHKWKAGEELRAIVTRSGFSINHQKTRMQYRTSRQDVTGLVVNKKVNIRGEYRRRVRAMAQHLFMTGRYDVIRTIPNAEGVLVPTKTEGTLTQLHGMLGYVDAVDRHNMKLRSKEHSEKSQKELSSKETLYRRFLVFKEFYAASAPVIVCEGKTDTVYLAHAIRNMAARYPALATLSPDNKVTVNVRMFKYPPTSTSEILRLTGGADVLNDFAWDYLREIKRFKAPGKEQPVVLVVDNDTGAKSICGSAKSLTKKDARSEPFLHLSENLYLVVLPVREGKPESEIEDFMGVQIDGIRLDGKTFSPKGDSDTHFGKHKLSQHIEANGQKFDFTGLAPILDRISAAVLSHRAKYGAAAAVVA
jgi:RNA-directed DNA polymerase